MPVTTITFLGSGSAFYDQPDNYQSNILVERGNRKLLIDCGSDIRFALRDYGLTMRDITDVYVSHAHADHIGGLEGLGFIQKFSGCPKPTLYLSSLLAKDLWDKSLSGGMESIQGEIADLSTYFNVERIKPNGYFVWQSIKFDLVQTIHIMNGYMFVPSFGLMFTVPKHLDETEKDTRIFFTSDTQHAPNQIMDFYNHADLIFHDCETMPYKSGVHAHYDDLCTLPEQVRSKMWLYHYNKLPTQIPTCQGFKGFVAKGQQFHF